MAVPKLRFKADNGSEFPDWEKIRFDEVFTSLNNNTLSRDNLNNNDGIYQNIHYGDIHVKYGSILDLDITDVPYINKNVNCKKYDLLQDGDIIIADTAEDYTVGKTIEVINVGEALITSGLHTMAWRPIIKFAPMYLGYYINSAAYHNQLRPFMQGIKVTSVNKSDISLTTISYPTYAEQQKIATLFSTIDTVITDCQSEVETWGKYKRGVMQQLFSQKVRFKADDGSEYPEWRKRALEECCDTFTDGNWIESKDQSDFGIRLIQTGNIGVTNYLDKPDTKKWISNETFNKLHCIEVFPGDILISRLPDPAGRACIIPDLGTRMITAVDCTIVRTSDECNSNFLVQYLSTSQYFNSVNSFLAGGTRQRISRSNLATITIPYPCLEEQQKIADCLSAFDEVIDKAKQKLEAYKQLKKGLLQQMFV